MLLQVLIQEALEGADSQLHPGIGDGEEAIVALPADLDGVAFPLALVDVGIGLPELGHKGLGVRAEDHPVDGLELQGIVVVVDDLYESVAGGKVFPLALRRHLLEVFITGLGGGQGMVAVAHGEEQGLGIPEAVLLLHGLGGAEGGKGIRDAVDLLGGELPAGEVAAALLEIEVIELLHLGALRRQGLDDAALGIVDEEHHVGQLDGGVLPDPDPGRDAGEDGALGGPDQCAGARGEVILVQIHHADEAVADLTVGLPALDVEKGIRKGLENALVQIPLHGGVDVRDVLVHVGVIELGLRQDQPQGGGGVAHVLLHGLPILRLGGELVAGHHGPLFHVGVLGQEDVGGIESQLLKVLHVVSPFHFFPPRRVASQSAARMAERRSSKRS